MELVAPRPGKETPLFPYYPNQTKFVFYLQFSMNVGLLLSEVVLTYVCVGNYEKLFLVFSGYIGV